MRFAAIDPGPERSAICELRPGGWVPHGILDNHDVLKLIRATGWKDVVIEMIASYGMPVGKNVFETCVWIGRFAQEQEAQAGAFHLVYRKDVRLHLCNHPRANDATIKQAIYDQFGGTRKTALGTKQNPGPLYGFKADLWQALAVGLTWADQQLARQWARDAARAGSPSVEESAPPPLS